MAKNSKKLAKKVYPRISARAKLIEYVNVKLDERHFYINPDQYRNPEVRKALELPERGAGCTILIDKLIKTENRQIDVNWQNQ